MKANLVEFNGGLELTLENGTKFTREDDSTVSEFLKQVAKQVNKELGEKLTTTAITEKSLSRKSSERLVKDLENGADGLLGELIVYVLNKRGVDVSFEEVDESEKPVEKPVEKSKAKTKSEPKKKAPAKESKPKVSKEEKAAALKKNLEEGLPLAKEAQEEARKNVGSVVSFTGFKTRETIKGIITGVGIDHRTNRVWYAIKDENGKYYNPTISNETIKIDEKATKALAEEKAAAKAAKAAKAEKAKKAPAKKASKK